jgi:predicted  nucleic acid-binding Zn-ribbon protein
MNNIPEIGLVAFENDLATLNETIYGAGEISPSSADIVACATESNAAPLVMTGTDAVIVGARMESSEDGQRLAKILRDLKYSRDKKRNRSLLGIVLWGNKAKEFSPLLPHPNVFFASQAGEEKLLRQRMGQYLVHALPHIETIAPLTRYEILAGFLDKHSKSSVSEISEAVHNAVQKELRSAYSRIIDLEDKISKLNNDNFTLQKRNDELEKAGQKLREDYTELVNHLRHSCRETISELTGRAEEIRALREELDKSHQHFGLAVDSLRSDIQNSGNSVAHFRQELDEGNQQAWSTLLKVEQRRVSSLNEQIEAIEQEKSALLAEITNLRGALAEVSNQPITTAKDSETINALQTELAKTEEKLREIHEERDLFASKTDSLEIECARYKEQIAKITEERDSLFNRVEMTADRYSDLEKELIELRHTFELNKASQSSFETLQEQVETLEKQCADLTAERDSKNEEITQLQAKYENLQRQSSEKIYQLTLSLHDAQAAANAQSQAEVETSEEQSLSTGNDFQELSAQILTEEPEAEIEFPEVLLGLPQVEQAATANQTVVEAKPTPTGILTNDDLATMTLTALPKDLRAVLDNAKNSVDIADLLREVGESVEPFLQGKPVKIYYEINPDSRYLNTDGKKLRQIVFNLLTNAAVFTEEGQVIVQTDWMSDRSFSLSIIDSGVGIQPEKLETIFQTGEDGFASECSLPATYNLVESLGGQIKARSWPGLGSLFVVRLPEIQ